MLFNLFLEGQLEEPVAEKILTYCGHELGTVYGKRGCSYLHSKVNSFQNLVNEKSGLLILTDFRDTKAACPSEAISTILKIANPPPNFICRFPVPELESWLLADAQSLAGFLGIPVSKVPQDPDKEQFPKQTLVNLARKGKKRCVCNDIVPEKDHAAPVAPLYVLTMTRFVLEHWNIDRATKRSPSLKRCIAKLNLARD